MKQFQGLSVPLHIASFRKVSDLIYYEGPLLSHYVSPAGENYLFYWVDSDDHYNRWLVVRTDENTIERYVSGQVSLHSVITKPNDGFVYMVDIDNDIQYHNIKVLPPTEFPDDYLPDEDSFYLNAKQPNSEVIRSTGKFYLLDIHSGRYAFESDGCQSTFGIFSDSLLPMMETITFSKFYNITVERSFRNVPGKDVCVRDCMISLNEAAR